MSVFEILYYSVFGVHTDLEVIKKNHGILCYLFDIKCPEFVICDEELKDKLIARGLKLEKISLKELKTYNHSYDNHSNNDLDQILKNIEMLEK